MRITLENGSVVERPFSPAACTGYVATAIEFNGRDVMAMKILLERDPSGFKAMMAQLAARFAENRFPGCQIDCRPESDKDEPTPAPGL